jgi:hypothetical protein
MMRSAPMTDDDKRRLVEYLERLGERRVRLLSAVDCDRFFGNWQARELIDDWLEDKVEERRTGSRFSGRVRRIAGLG